MLQKNAHFLLPPTRAVSELLKKMTTPLGLPDPPLHVVLPSGQDPVPRALFHRKNLLEKLYLVNPFGAFTKSLDFEKCLRHSKKTDFPDYLLNIYALGGRDCVFATLVLPSGRGALGRLH